jgi:hypothetical protein
MSQVKRKAEEDKSHEITKKFKLESKEAKRVTSFERPQWLMLVDRNGVPLEHAVFAAPGESHPVGGILVPSWWFFVGDIWEEIQEATVLPGTLSRLIASYISHESAKMKIWYHTRLFQETHVLDPYAGILLGAPFENDFDVTMAQQRWYLENKCARQFWNDKEHRRRCGIGLNAEIRITPHCVHESVKLEFTVPVCKLL